MILENQKQVFTWKYNNKSKEDIKRIVNNFTKVRNVYLANLIILDDGTTTFTTYSKIEYEELVNKLVKEKYSDSDEFAILRKAISNPNNDEYLIYNAYVEDCKVRAREFVDERESVLGDNK